ncbi:hypothetical protein DPX16_18228 [Anabarilius grahami]|uniref:Uncharacterized protein n=1 Tax=Anabarilius grahami TaxID=495550 RepID=A0A3N0YEC4_ANAGA|nr:hypothetical protein DPX16_18228 [Anabarilius grahami]
MIFVTRFQSEAVIGLTLFLFFSAKRNGRAGKRPFCVRSVAFKAIRVQFLWRWYLKGEQFSGCEVAVGKWASLARIPFRQANSVPAGPVRLISPNLPYSANVIAMLTFP